MSSRGLGMVLLLGSTLVSPSRGGAQELLASSTARHRLRYTSLLAGQYNPLGLQGELQVGYRYRLLESERPLLADTHAGFFAATRVNPAFARLGVGLELQPLAVLALRVLYEHRLYFGAFGMLQSFGSPAEAYDEQTLRARARDGAHYPARGHELTVQAVVRARVGPIALLEELSLIYFRMGLREGGRVFYDNLLDALVPGDGLVVVNNAHLFWLRPPLVVGVRYTLVHAGYPEEWLGAEGNLNTPNHRLGPIVAWLFRDLGPRARQPMLVLIVNWWISNRYRSPSAIPYGVLAFQLSGDLWSR